MKGMSAHKHLIISTTACQTLLVIWWKCAEQCFLSSVSLNVKRLPSSFSVQSTEQKGSGARAWLDCHGVCFFLPRSWLVTVRTSFFRLSFHCFTLFQTLISFLFSPRCCSAFSWCCSRSQLDFLFFSLSDFWRIMLPALCAMPQLISIYLTWQPFICFTTALHCIWCCEHARRSCNLFNAPLVRLNVLLVLKKSD